MKVTAWGRYPVIESRVFTPATESAVTQLLGDADKSVQGIARGLGRSYSDSSLATPVDMPSMLLKSFFDPGLQYALFQPRASQKIDQHPSLRAVLLPAGRHIDQWNRMYGKNNFTQYQFVLPKSAGLEGMKTVLERISASKRGSFLAVLKAFGKGSDNYLSFPMEGYTLALDFKLDQGLFALLDELDKIVLDYGAKEVFNSLQSQRLEM